MRTRIPLNRRAGLLVDNLGVVNAFIGEELQGQFATAQTLIAQLNESDRQKVLCPLVSSPWSVI